MDGKIDISSPITLTCGVTLKNRIVKAALVIEILLNF
jgi:hypothetical protein